MTPTNPEAVERLIKRLRNDGARVIQVGWEPDAGDLMIEAADALTAANARVVEEREACAKICQHVREIVGASTGSSIAIALAEAADRIRSRERLPA